VGSLHAAILALKSLKRLLDMLELRALLTTGVSPSWSSHLLQGVLIHLQTAETRHTTYGYLALQALNCGTVYTPGDCSSYEGIALCIFDALKTIVIWAQYSL